MTTTAIEMPIRHQHRRFLNMNQSWTILQVNGLLNKSRTWCDTIHKKKKKFLLFSLVLVCTSCLSHIIHFSLIFNTFFFSKCLLPFPKAKHQRQMKKIETLTLKQGNGRTTCVRALSCDSFFENEKHLV